MNNHISLTLPTPAGLLEAWNRRLPLTLCVARGSYFPTLELLSVAMGFDACTFVQPHEEESKTAFFVLHVLPHVVGM
jgi:hypothetical protein